MHDLSTISRLNAEAHQRAILRERAAGRHVLVRYAGLQLISHTSHDSYADALAAAQAAPAEASERLDIWGPLGPAHAALLAGRDQSEDYTAA